MEDQSAVCLTHGVKEVCKPCSRLQTGHSKLSDNQNLRCSYMEMTTYFAIRIYQVSQKKCPLAR